MLTYLLSLLDTYDVPGAGMFNYLSTRAVVTFILALMCSTIGGKYIIRALQRRQIGETIRDLDLEGQMSKKGTPTMGGLIIIFAIVVPCLLMGNLVNIYMILMLVTTLWLGGLGFLDDYIKVIKKDKKGLKGKYKILGQFVIGLVVGLSLYLSPQSVMQDNQGRLDQFQVKKEQSAMVSSAQMASAQIVSSQNVDKKPIRRPIKSTRTTLPFFKNHHLDYAEVFAWAGEYQQVLGWTLFIFVVVFVVMGVSNGANLTDGLDGIATGSSAIQGVTLGILAYVSGNINYASYLDIMYIPGAGELLVFAAAFIGATIGFLWYNSYPAQVFMGDTGSLALGGIIAVFAIAIRKELLIPILSGLFLVESLSVIVQTAYFKYTKKKTGVGRRVFKMAPLHHHYQKEGNSGIEAIFQKPLQALPESKITVRFWIIGLLLAALTLATLKMR